MKRFIISEEDKKHIRGLYEQSTETQKNSTDKKIGDKYEAIWVNKENPNEQMGEGGLVMTVEQETENPRYLLASMNIPMREWYSQNSDNVYSHPDFKWGIKVIKKL